MRSCSVSARRTRYSALGFAHAKTFGQQLIESGLGFLRQGLVQHRTQGRAVLVLLFPLLAPHRPILGRRADGGVFAVIFVGADHQLGVGEQRRDVLVALVADHLRHRLRHLGIRRFAFDHREGDAVDEQHDVRPRRLVAARALHRKFGGDVIDVVLRIFPVDVVEREAAHRPFHRLFQRHAQRQQVIDRLIGFQQAVVLDVLQALDGALEVFLAEQVTVALVLDAIDALEAVAQYLFQQHVGEPSAAHCQCLGRRQVAIAEIGQQLQGGDLREVFFVETERCF